MVAIDKTQMVLSHNNRFIVSNGQQPGQPFTTSFNFARNRKILSFCYRLF